MCWTQVVRRSAQWLASRRRPRLDSTGSPGIFARRLRAEQQAEAAVGGLEAKVGEAAEVRVADAPAAAAPVDRRYCQEPIPSG